MSTIYKTLADLKKAYESGELHRDWKVMVDNDCVWVDAPCTPTLRRMSADDA